MESTIADLQHRLERATRERSRASGGGGRYELATLALGLQAPTGAPASFPAAPVGPQAGFSGVMLAPSGGSHAMEEMASRLASAERERDTIEQQRRTLSMQARSLSESQASERSAAAARLEQTQRQLRRLEDDVASLRQERARLLGHVAELEQQLHAAQTELSQVRPPTPTPRPRTR